MINVHPELHAARRICAKHNSIGIGFVKIKNMSSQCRLIDHVLMEYHDIPEIITMTTARHTSYFECY